MLMSWPYPRKLQFDRLGVGAKSSASLDALWAVLVLRVPRTMDLRAMGTGPKPVNAFDMRKQQEKEAAGMGRKTP